ncbi:transposase [Synechocystis salina LEGE 06155]|nr:transposase [Synechocystis salina LEGE 06155]
MCEYIIPFFDYPPDIRRVIYSTNVIESLHRSFRKVIKTKGIFPSQDSLLKLLYLAWQSICRQWTMPIQHWKAALACFAIEHPNSFLISPLHKFLDTPAYDLPWTISLLCEKTGQH